MRLRERRESRGGHLAQRIGDDGERLVDLGGGDGERRDEAKGLEDGGGEQQQAALAACPLQPG